VQKGSEFLLFTLDESQQSCAAGVIALPGDDDEVLVAIAKSLGNFIDHVGGPQYAETLLPTLELLLTVGKFHSRVFSINLDALTCTPHMNESLIANLCGSFRGEHCSRRSF
jgi:hypothetical protein